MPDNKPAEQTDVTKAWRATQGQKSAAGRLRLFAALAWIIAIAGEAVAIVLLYRHKFDHGNLGLLIGILVGIVISIVVYTSIWPESEADNIRGKLAGLLRALGAFVRPSPPPAGCGARPRPDRQAAASWCG